MLTAHTNASVNSAILQDYKSAYGITSKNQIIAEWNMNAYNDIKTYGVIDTDLNQRIQEGTDQIPIEIDSTTASYSFIKNYERRKYSDLGAVFEPVRPDVNILNYVHSRFRRNIVDDVSEIRVNNLNPYSVRLYPFSENFKGYSWSSIRTKLSSDKTDVTYTGISDSNGNIKDADVYVNYSSSFYINKLTFKTQYYNGFPASFSIYITNNITSSSNWTLIYSYSGASASSPLSGGQLDLYYNYSSSAWTTASSSNTLVTDLDSTSNQFTAIQGIRIKVEKMYNPNSTTNLSGQDFQLIEISPRLVADITEYTKSFSINSQIADSQFGMPVGGIISSTGNIELSNMAKYFSNNSTNSIIKNYLNPNVKFNFYQLVDKTVSGSAITARIPLKTLYALRWEENSEFSTNIELEDYTKFFKEKASPDIVIANNSGVPVSVALLQLLDNIGFNKYIFRKTSNSADIEDVILQFFYSRKENTLAQTLEELARSAQLSMYFDAENNFIVMTKEKVSKPLPKESASWWFIADPENLSVSDEEYSILNSSSYVSNIKTFEKSTNPPITDARIGYNGLGIQKEPYDLVTNPDLRELLDSQQLDAAPILSRNLRYATTNLWSSNNDNKNILLSGTLMENIPGSVLSEMKNLSASPITVQASNEYDAIRQYYFSKNAETQKYLKIVLDPTSMETFVANQSYNGTLLIDDEYISFKGILFDHHPYQGTATSSIIFNERERQGLRSSLPSGSTLSPKALILYLDFDIKNQTSSVIFDASGSLTYQLNYHGRGVTTYQTSEISEHYGVISASSLSNWTPFTTRIMTANEYKPSGTPTYTIVSDPSLVNKSLSDSSLKSYPGYLRLSGLKFDNTTASGIFGSTSSSAAFLGIKFNYKVDTDISGIAYSSSVKFNLIATRMRILQYTKPPQKIVDVNRDVQDLSGIGGIFFGLKNEGTASTTGYFVELASAGQTNDAQLESNDLENLRLYKISYSTSASRTEVSLLGKAAVAVASTAQATKDVKAVTEEGSFTAISDLRVLIEDNSIEVYWEDQKVITYRNSGIKNEIFKNATKSGLFVRGNTVALFEYFLASPSNIAPYLDTFDKGLSISDAERGILTRTVKEVKSKKLVNVFYEDFGKVVKEIKKINVRFEPPAVKAQVLDFGIKNSKYYIPNFSSTSFGANFWILNTSNDIIKIGEDSSVPIYIAGFALTKSNADNSYVEMQDFIDAQQNKFNIDEADNEFSKITSNIEKNKLYYGENTLTIDTEYIFTYQQAYELLSWLVKNYTKERITVNMEIYANPLLELGDIVRVFYREKGFTQNKIGDKSFIITGIEHSVSSNGPTMNVEIRECF